MQNKLLGMKAFQFMLLFLEQRSICTAALHTGRSLLRSVRLSAVYVIYHNSTESCGGRRASMWITLLGQSKRCNNLTVSFFDRPNFANTLFSQIDIRGISVSFPRRTEALTGRMSRRYNVLTIHDHFSRYREDPVRFVESDCGSAANQNSSNVRLK